MIVFFWGWETGNTAEMLQLQYVLLEQSCFTMLCQFLLYQQSGSVSCLHTSPPPGACLPPLHPTLCHHRALSSLSYAAASHQLAILHLVVYTCQSHFSQFIPPPLPPSLCPHICSLHLCLYSCPVSRFFCTSFLGSTYMPCECMLRPLRLFATLRTVAHQAPLSMECFRQEYWSGLPFSPPTYIHYYTVFVFLFLTYFTLYDSLQVHPHLYKQLQYLMNS